MGYTFSGLNCEDCFAWPGGCFVAGVASRHRLGPRQSLSCWCVPLWHGPCKGNNFTSQPWSAWAFIACSGLANCLISGLEISNSHHECGVVSLHQSKSGLRTGAQEAVAIRDSLTLQLLDTLFSVQQHFPGDRLWPYAAQTFRDSFKRALQYFDVLHLGFKPYSLRRGGATYLLQCNVALESILIRGRWRSLGVARLYLEDGLAQIPALRVDPSHQEKILYWANKAPRTAGTILELQITMEFHRQLIHQHHLQPHLQCGNDPTVANHNGILSTTHMHETHVKPHLQCGTDPSMIREYPSMIRPHTRPSRNRRTAEVDHRGSGTDFVWKNIGFRASAISQKRISCETSFETPSATPPPAPRAIPFTLREQFL